MRLIRFAETLSVQIAVISLNLYFACDQLSMIFPGIEIGKIFYIIFSAFFVYIANRFRNKYSLEYSFFVGCLYAINFIITIYILIFTFKGINTSIKNVIYAFSGIIFVSLVILFGSLFDSKNQKTSNSE